MMESTGLISSAVILPDPDHSKSPRTKRRQSSASADIASKRPRLSNASSAESPQTLRASPPSLDSIKQDLPAKVESDEKLNGQSTDRRKSSVQEEKKRGQRLFGGLLSTLSQSTPNGQQKRRLEIEKRQAEKAKQQRLDDESRKAEKLTKLKETRKIEQVKYDEESMQIRHSNMLAMAHFLCTSSKPKIYYKPWQLLPSDEGRIKSQIAEVEAIISREVNDFNKRHPERHPKPDQVVPEADTTNTSEVMVGEPQAESPSASNNVSNDSTNPNKQDSRSEQVATEKTSPEEHNGEVVVEAEEDTVIY